MANIRFLIIRQDRIGDVVLSTPLPREIKRKYPDAYVAMLVREYTRDIFFNNPHVDEVITLEELKAVSFFSAVKKIRSFKFNFSFMLLPNEYINYLMFFSGIRKRTGVGHKFYQFITATRSVLRNKYKDKRHEGDYCLDFLRKYGIEPKDNSPEIFLSEEEKLSVTENKKRLSEDGKKRIIGVHSTSGNSAPNMTSEEYKLLIIGLLKRDDVKVVVTDNLVPDTLKSLSDLDCINVNKSLRESIINFASLDLLISASTGPMHLASALKVDTLSMFCPLDACAPHLWGPVGNKSEVILPGKSYCSIKCPGDPKICKFEGEGGINADRILKTVLINNKHNQL